MKFNLLKMFSNKFLMFCKGKTAELLWSVWITHVESICSRGVCGIENTT